MSSTAQMEWTPTRQAILGPEPSLRLYGEVSVWFHKLELFRREENERMFQREPDQEDLAIHRTLILRLIADGAHLLELIEQDAGLVSNREGIKVEDLRAAVEGLRDSFRGWHESMPPEHRKQILTEVFGDVA
jgi:hypothetical protein